MVSCKKQTGQGNTIEFNSEIIWLVIPFAIDASSHPEGGRPSIQLSPPSTQHCKSDGPVQYPGTDVPLHELVCTQTPLPYGVLQVFEVQHLISDEPGQSPDVTVPVAQHPPEIDTQAPSIPPTLYIYIYIKWPYSNIIIKMVTNLQVASYEHKLTVFSKSS